MIENSVESTIKGIDGEVVVNNTAEASSLFGTAAFIIIVYYGRIAPYSYRSRNKIYLYLYVGGKAVTQAKRPWNPLSLPL